MARECVQNQTKCIQWRNNRVISRAVLSESKLLVKKILKYFNRQQIKTILASGFKGLAIALTFVKQFDNCMVFTSGSSLFVKALI